ncbi:MAG: hypothetical protein QXS38_01330 [Candidatus Pacearchaeota archaeon]
MVDWTSFAGGTIGGAALGALLAWGIAIAVIIIAAVYVYSALAWMTIGKKLRYKYPWLAWIPFANISMILQMGGFHWAWVFLLLVPFVGIIAVGIFMLICCWRIFEKRKYPGWLALVPLIGFVPMLGALASIAFLVILGLVAWRDN